jgi:hypothetical protein
MFKTRDRLAEKKSDGASQAVIGKRNRLGIALPEPEEAFTARLQAFARGSAAHTDTFSRPEEVDALLRSAEFVIETCHQIGVDRATSKENAMPRNSTRRYLVTAGRKADQSVAGCGV